LNEVICIYGVNLLGYIPQIIIMPSKFMSGVWGIGQSDDEDNIIIGQLEDLEKKMNVMTE